MTITHDVLRSVWISPYGAVVTDRELHDDTTNRVLARWMLADIAREEDAARLIDEWTWMLVRGDD